jgi:hypothetical protein
MPVPSQPAQVTRTEAGSSEVWSLMAIGGSYLALRLRMLCGQQLGGFLRTL